MILSKVAFPKEHGSWGFVLEPLTLSLIVAYTFDGLLVALATFFLFLSNQPLKIILNKSSSKKNKSVAWFVLPAYIAVAFSFLIFSIFHMNFNSVFILVTGFVLMIVYLIAELQKLSRKLIIEFLPIFALALIALSIVTINHDIQFNPIVFLFILLSRSVPTVFYVNTKVKQSKGFNFSPNITHTINLLFTISILILTILNLAPVMSLLGMLLISGRAIVGFTKFNFTNSVMQIGITEFIVGILFVIINGIGFYS